MDEPAELRNNRHWRAAVWALRVGYLGLAVGIAGLVAWSLGSTPWLLAVGVIIWIVTAGLTLTEVGRSRRQLAGPRPGFWSTRWMLLYDTVHTAS